MNELKTFKKVFDFYLAEYLDRKIKNLGKFTKDSSILNYIHYLKEISLSGGKRIRPYLAYLIYQALCEKENKKEALAFLVFLEIFHTFCLIHDDIMDKSSLRHKIPTINSYVETLLKRDNRSGDLNHVGNSQAILLGDILFSWSQEIINTNKYFSSKIISKINEHFYDMVDEVCIGQMIDVDIVTRKNVLKNLIDEKTKLKTAGYSFIKPLLIGAALSGNTNKKIEDFCQNFGLTMGTAFQIQDDLLDMTSSEKILGKTTGLDKSQNQHTYFTYFPSLEYGKKIIGENFKQARKLIKNSSINENGKKRLFDLVSFLEERNS
jgi:geranylgeranyl diphosphate synthase, type I